MNTTLATIALLSSLYLFFLSFAVGTQNLRSAMVFKFLPFLFGLGTMVIALKGFEIIA